MLEFDIKKAKSQFWNQMSQAKARNIPFLFTFEEWLQIWLDSGHYHERGIGKDKYCMSRYNDTGPYSVNNVFIQTISKNSRDQKGRSKPAPWMIGRKRDTKSIEKMKETRKNNGFNYATWSGKTMTIESSNKKSIALKGRPWTEARRKAQQMKKEKMNGI